MSIRKTKTVVPRHASGNNRPLQFEKLENRRCLYFSASWQGNVLTFEGDIAWHGGFGIPPIHTPRADELSGIALTGTTITYETTDNVLGAAGTLTRTVPAPAGPFWIWIYGRERDDIVDVFAGAPGLSNLAGFTPRTMVKGFNFVGGPGDDTLKAPVGIVELPALSHHPNITFWGGSGGDTLHNMGDPEAFNGGTGADRSIVTPGGAFLPGGGNDWIDGGPDLDPVLEGGIGDDRIDGGPAFDKIDGGDGRDTLNGGPDNSRDHIIGGRGNDEIRGGDGNDWIIGGEGDDDIWGGPGSDVISGGPHDDEIYTGPSAGFVISPGFKEFPTVPADTFFEIVVGDGGADLINGSEAQGPVYAHAGDGSNTVFGGPLADELFGGPRNDWLIGNGGADLIDAGDGDDRVWGPGDWGEAFGGSGNDDMWGAANSPDHLFGEGDDDVIWSAADVEAAWADQPWNGAGPNVNLGWPDMSGSGGPGCDVVDGHEDNPNGCNRRPRIDDGIGYALPGDFLPIDLTGNPHWTVEIVSQPTYGMVVSQGAGTILYYAPGCECLDVFSYKINDGQQDSNTATYTFKVGDWDSAPPERGFVIQKNVTQLVVPAPGLLDGMGEFDEVELVGNAPGDGDFTLNANGSFEYGPDEGFTGIVSFWFVASNSTTGEESEPMRVDIEVPDYSTRAFLDEYETRPGGTLSDNNGILWNDDWADMAVLVAAGPSASGSLTLNGDGTFVFQPAQGFSGNYSFTYKAKDSVTGNESAPTTVTIYVSPIATLDDVYPMSSTATELEIDAAEGVLDNDTGADTVELIEDDGPAFGTVTLNSDGSFTYVPPTGFIGTDFFSYFAVNSTAGDRSVPTTVRIHVGPHAEPDGIQMVDGISLIIPEADLLNNDFLGDEVALVPGSGPSNGSLTANGNGTFTYQPSPSFSGTVSFQYQVIDTATGDRSPPATVTIHVVRPVANGDTYTMTVSQGSLTTSGLGVRANDFNADVAELVTGLEKNSGTIQFNGNGTFTYTPNSTFGGTESFTYRVRNQQTGVWSAPATVTVLVNRPPPAATDDDYWIYDAGYSYDLPLYYESAPGVLANDHFGDTVALTPEYAEWYGDYGYQTFSLTVNPDGSFSFYAAHIWGTFSFDYQAINSVTGERSAPARAWIHVSGYVPVAEDDEYTIAADIPFSNNIMQNDSWARLYNAYPDPELHVVGSGPTNGTLYINAQGQFTYIPGQGFTGIDSFQYYLRQDLQIYYESWWSSEVATVTINVLDVQPDGQPDTFEAASGWSFFDSVVTNDNFANAWQLVTQPAHGTVVFASDGSFEYASDIAYEGGDTFQYRALNTALGYQSSVTTVTVNLLDYDASGYADEYSVIKGQELEVAASGVLDNDLWAVSAVLVSGPSNGTLTLSANGSFTYVPDMGFVGTDSFEYSPRSMSGVHAGPVVVLITVYRPIAVDDYYWVMIDNTLEEASPGLLINDSHADAVVLVSGPNSGSLTLNEDGSFVYVPDEGFTGMVTFTYRAKDLLTGEESDDATVTIEIGNSP